jgi:hypothetical protein
MNLGSYCGGPYVNCTANQEYSVSKKKCVDKVEGYCQPTSGSWLLDSCSSCQKCSGEGEECPGYVKGGKSLCVQKINCENWDTTCNGNAP